MKLVTTAGALLAGLKTVGRVIGRRSRLPLLQCVLIEDAKLVGTNLDVELAVKIPAERAEGMAAISYHPLRRLVEGIPADETVTLDVIDVKATLTFGEAVYQLPAHAEPDSFPRMPTDGLGRLMRAGGDLAPGLRFALSCVSTEETRYYLNGVYFDKFQDSPTLVSTDGHRLAARPATFPKLWAGNILPILPARILADCHSEIKGAINKKTRRARFTFAGVEMRAKLIDGTYPNWQAVLPGDNILRAPVEFDRAQLGAAVRRVRAIGGGRQSPSCLLLAAHDGTAGLKYTNNALEAGGQEFLGGVDTPDGEEPITASFNARYFDELLRVMNRGDRIRLRTSVDWGSPIRIEDDGDAFCILMPMRSNDSLAEFASEVVARAGAK